MSDQLNKYSFCKVILLNRIPEELPALMIEAAPASDEKTPGSPTNEVGDIVLIKQPSQQPNQKLVVSLGLPSKITLEVLRRAGSSAIRWLAKNGYEQAGLDPALLIGLFGEDGVVAFLEGMALGSFRFNRYKKSDEKEPGHPVIQVFAENNALSLSKKISEMEIITSATNLARDWGHEPANIINPITLVERVRQLFSGPQIKVTVLDEHQLADLKAGALLAVGQGSKTPARLIILEYPGTETRAHAQPVVLVGKALTFDSGGYSLKNTENIVNMKYDKCGGMAVIATLLAAAELQLRWPVIGIIAAAENMISENAYRPDDIITTLSGKTVEIITTDAEGRLVLADALTYAQNMYKPKALIDLATLTGGVVVALGHVRAGIMSNDDSLTKALSTAGDQTYERLWQLPLDEEFFKLIQGDDADIKNSGGREGHAILGGMFLKQFIGDNTAWAHLDIAGMADTSKESPYSPKGATGFGVRLLIEYLKSLD